jgi:protein-disulfide isomerase
MSKLAVPVSERDHKEGSLNARCTLVEYGDYECSHCGEAYPIVKRLQKEFGEELLFVFRNFPLNQIHEHAEHAAETAEFAAASDRFWQMHDLLFENQENLEDNSLVRLATQLHLSGDKLSKTLEEGTYRDHIKAEFMGGVRSGVNGTPTFFIDGQRHDSSFDFADLAGAIRRHTGTGNSPR